MNNKKIGNSVEKTTRTYLASLGFWAHLLVDNANGQPFDIVAIKGDHTLCVDAKNLKDNIRSFTFARIEGNQWNSMTLIKNISSAICGFAIYHCGVIYFASFEQIKACLERGEKSIPIPSMPTLKRYLENVYASK